MPESLKDKIIVTNTTTREDIELLRERGSKMLVTTTPDLEGRSFGTNVMEALVVALLEKDLASIGPEDYQRVIRTDLFKPRVVYFN